MGRARLTEDCPTCGKRRPKRACAGCGRPVAESAEKLYRAILRTFAGDAEATAVITDGFKAMLSPTGGGCTNHLDALLGMCREVVSTYGVPE